jgi:hypothetical protein
MTVPMERTNAVVETEKFLLDLLDPKKTPKIPKVIRQRAGSLLRHYPREHEMTHVATQLDEIFGDSPKVFGRGWK